MSQFQKWIEGRIPQLTNNIKASARDKNRTNIQGVKDTATMLDFLVDFLYGNSNEKDKHSKKIMDQYLKGVTDELPIEHQAQKFNRTGLLNQAIRDITDKEIPELIYQNLNGFRQKLQLKPSYIINENDIEKWRKSGDLKKYYLDKFNNKELLHLFNDIAQTNTKVNYLELFA